MTLTDQTLDRRSGSPDASSSAAVHRRRLRDDDQIRRPDSGPALVLNTSRINRLALIPHDRAPDLPAGDDAEAGSRRRQRERQRWSDNGHAPCGRRRRRAGTRPGGACAGPGAGRGQALAGVRDCEALAALGAAALQHLAPVLGRHADQEPVGLLPAPAIRLECTFALHDSWKPLQRFWPNGETIDTNEPASRVSIAARNLSVIKSLSRGGSRRCAVGSPPEVFHSCGKNCGKAPGESRNRPVNIL